MSEYYDLQFGKSGPGQWTSRDNNYVITRVSRGVFVIRDGHGIGLNTAPSLAKAKRFASVHHVVRHGLEGYATS